MEKLDMQNLWDKFLKHNPSPLVVLTMLNYYNLITKEGKELFEYLHWLEKEIIKENSKIIAINSKKWTTTKN